jgi:hypothetical protein
LLLVNPLIHDFAAYDFWARPLGLLTVAAHLVEAGAKVTLLDCTDPLSPWLPSGLRPRRRPDGRGRFPRTALGPTWIASEVGPEILRRFSRYGLPPEQITAALASLPRPDAVLMTSTMTYWYPGVRETVALIKRAWSDVPLLLGGIYATLCPDHANRCSGADRVVPGPLEDSLAQVSRFLGLKLDLQLQRELGPAHQLLPHADAAALSTSSGCPYRCAYCGVQQLSPRYRRRSPELVEQEVRLITGRLGIRHIALYDDALLADPPRAVEILERIAHLDLAAQIHAASGLSCRGLTAQVAQAMKRAGFATIRLGLETGDEQSQRRLGGKVTLAELCAALGYLEDAGYSRGEVGVYVMVGLPGQGLDEVATTLEQVLEAGARPHLAEYSPVPQSPLFAQATAASRWDLEEEPLFHNPTLLPCAGPDLDFEALVAIKQRLRRALGP